MGKHETLLLVLIMIFFVAGQYGFHTTDGNKTTVLPSRGNEVTVPVIALDASGKGIVGTVSAVVTPGMGKMMIDLSGSLPDTSAQESAVSAVDAAFSISGVKADVIYKFALPADVAAGPSAGAALAVAVAAAMQNKSVRNGIAITGAIENDGTITAASGIYEKAIAAKAAGFSMMLIPSRGGPDVTGYKKRVECKTVKGLDVCTTDYIVDAAELSKATGIVIKGIDNLTQAMMEMIDG